MSEYVHKADLSDRIYGIEQYIPGDTHTGNLGIKVTSGTSGNGPSVLVENAQIDKKYPRYLAHLHRVLKIGSQNVNALIATRLMFLHAPLERVLVLDKKDFDHPDISRLIAEFDPSEVYAAPVSLFKILKNTLQSLSPLARVTRIFFSGEFITAKQKQAAISDLPGTVEAVNEYGLAEGGSHAFSCPYLDKTYMAADFAAMHPTSNEIEIYRPDEKGIGEIVVYTNELSRYRTGDMGKLISETCSCGADTTLELYGRKDFDVVSCAGALFILPEIDRVFETLKDLVAEYQVVVREHDTGKTIHGSVHLRIVPTHNIPDPRAFKKTIINQFEKRLFITPTRTLTMIQAEGIFNPSTITIEQEIQSGRKNIRLKKERV